MQLSKKIIIPILGLALVFATAATLRHTSKDTPPLIDREIFFGNPEIIRGKLSPDGRYLSFLKPHENLLHIWIKTLDEPFEQARRVTSSIERPVRSYLWSRDGEYLLYTMDSGGDENFHLFALNPSNPSEPPRDLTPLPGVRAELVCLPEQEPKIAFVALNDRDARYHDLYRINLTTGERTSVQINTHQLGGWLFDHNAQLRLAVRINESGGTEILSITPDGVNCVLSCSKEDSLEPLAFHKDNRHVYIATNAAPDTDTTCLALFDTETGEVERLESDPEHEVDLCSAWFSNVSKELVATTYLGDTTRIYFSNPEWKNDFERLRKDLPQGEISILSSTADERLWLVGVHSDKDPEQAFLFDRTTGKTSFLYRAMTNLPSKQLAPMTPITYTSRDGLVIHGYLTVPKGSDAKNLPLVVMPHGGPNHRDTWGYNGYAQFFANRGYACLQMNFRGSTGYGKAFVNAGNKQWGDTMQNDISDGVLYCIHNGIADPKRVAIFGGSYGGYAALAGLAFTPEFYAAGISFVGPSNLITLLQTIPPYWAVAKGIEDERIGNLDNPEDVVRLKRQSPLFSAHKITAPLLVVQGANDPRVKKAESDQIVAALQNLGRTVEYLVAPDEGHGFACRDNRLAFAAVAERFLADHIGGRCQTSLSEPIAKRLEAMTVVGTSTKKAHTP